MNTHLAAEEEIEDYEEYESDEPSGFGLRDGGTDLFRGVLVTLIALAVGAFILARGYSSDPVDQADEDSSLTAGELTAADPTGTLTSDTADPAAPETGEEATGDAMTDDSVTDDAMADDGSTTDDAMTDDTTADGSTDDTTDTTAGLTETVRTPADVEVVVLNATDRKGIAGQATELLGNSSYNTAPAGNASQSMGSIIYYMEGYRADAIAVSQVFIDGLEGLVQPYDPSSPPASADDIGTAKVIVILGIDDAIPIG